MADDWEDEDEWDVDNNINPLTTSTKNISTVNDDFDNEEEDLAIVEKQKSAKIEAEMNKTKGKALLEKKRAEEERKEEMEIARRALELEAEMEENMTLEERRQLEKQRIESADHALTDDLFGAVDGSHPKTESSEPGDVVKMKDLKDHLKHARKVAQCIKGHGKIALATAFLKECLQECSSVLDDDAVTEIIRVCNVIKNDKIAAAKLKAKGQAQKATKKRDKVAEAAAKKMAEELYGANDKFDRIDELAADYEDDFF